MPWTPAQRRLFAVQYRKGELSKAEFDRRMGEGVRKDVDRTGHARKKKRDDKRKKRRTSSRPGAKRGKGRVARKKGKRSGRRKERRAGRR
jgi:hypothetical protein